jgi:hypothetical protein
LACVLLKKKKPKVWILWNTASALTTCNVQGLPGKFSGSLFKSAVFDKFEPGANGTYLEFTSK